MLITSLYAGLLALLFVALSTRAVLLRRRLGIAIGDAGNAVMLRAMRAQANCAEYAPLGLLLIFLVEQGGANPRFVHTLGLCLLIGRLVHAFGVSRVKERYAYRVIGMVLTFSVIISAALRLLSVYIARNGL